MALCENPVPLKPCDTAYRQLLKNDRKINWTKKSENQSQKKQSKPQLEKNKKHAKKTNSNPNLN